MKSLFVATSISFVIHGMILFIPVDHPQPVPLVVVIDPAPKTLTQKEILDQQQLEMDEPLLTLQCKDRDSTDDHSVSSSIIKHKKVVASATKNARAANTGY